MKKVWLLVFSLFLTACDAYPPTPQTDEHPAEQSK
jgi:starvation-inducible outer membrane lipoprotein